MKSKLGKAVLIAAGALAVAGVSAPAYADVAAGGGGGFFATSEDPFIIGGQEGFAETDHIFTWFQRDGFATSTTLGEGGDGGAAIG